MKPLTLRKRIARFLESEDGTTAIEYAVMLALIIAVCVGTVRNMANATRSTFDSSAEAIENAGQ